MTPVERVQSARRMLGLGAVLQSVGWGLTAALGLLALLSFAALIDSDLATDTRWQVVTSAMIGTVVAGLILWRSRHLASIQRVALWIEERVPSLHYSLVTALEGAGAPFTEGIERTISRESFADITRRAVVHSAGPAIGAALVAGLLLYISPSPVFGGGRLAGGAAGSTGRAVPAGSRLDGLDVQVTPPAYSRERSTRLDDPSSVAALVGSRISISGDGAADGVTGDAGGMTLRIADGRRGWTTSLTMPAKPAALTLRDRGYERIIVLEPRPDNPPRIVLTSPERDSILRVPQLVLRLSATATDDVGLSGAYFEYLISSGSGEIFSARTITTPVVQFNSSRRGSIDATLDLSTLRLSQGDVVSIRAITRDVNTLTGPGLATSDTRTYRIARADEYDSVAVDPAGPLPVDSSAMSQRMLILMTEKLVREQKGLTRQELVRRSTEIGDLEDRIRKRVHEILFEQEGGEEADAGAAAPEAAETMPEEHAHSEEAVPMHNRDLLEAYNALWEAVRSLQIAEPEPALPPMRVALKALDRARLANRMYLRGLPPKIVVDLARVRMTGKEKGSGNVRTPLTPADSARVRIERRFEEAIGMIEARPADAIRAFTLVQVEALSSSPSFASALGEAIDAMKKGRDATAALLRARRLLSGNPVSQPGLPAWSGAW
jgi:hypothetical protein